jgi:hypothetical protein
MPMFIPAFVPAERFAARSSSRAGDSPSPAHACYWAQQSEPSMVLKYANIAHHHLRRLSIAVLDAPGALGARGSRLMPSSAQRHPVRYRIPAVISYTLSSWWTPAPQGSSAVVGHGAAVTRGCTSPGPRPPDHASVAGARPLALGWHATSSDNPQGIRARVVVQANVWRELL